MKNNRIILSVGILLVLVCVCLSAIVVVGGGAYLLGKDQIAGLFPSATLVPAPSTPTTLPTVAAAIPTPVGTPTSGVETPQAAGIIPPEVAAQLDTIQGQVSRIRGLAQPDSISISVLTTEQLRQKVENDFLVDYTEADVEDDVRVLSAFGLLEPDYDLYNLYLELYTEQIAGYYDIDKDEMYVVQDEAFAGPQRSTYAHEFTHALQNSAHDVRKTLNYTEEACEVDSEHCAAIQALIEGDASLTEQSWLYLYATDEDRQEIEDYYATTDLSVYDSAPAFLQEDFLFPYSQGVDFVLTLFEEGGFERIDQAYSNPPVSTEQILHPERYPNDDPVAVELPSLSELLGRDLRELDRGVMGEWYTYLILARGSDKVSRIKDSQAAAAAEGWGGDSYAVSWDEEAQMPVTVLLTIWDTTEDAAEFYNTFKNFGDIRYGPSTTSAGGLSWDAGNEGSVSLLRSGDRTLWVTAPTPSDASLIIQSLSAESILGVR